MYKLLSKIFDFTGVVSFWFCMIRFDFGTWTILLSAIVMFAMFGVQIVVNNILFEKGLI